MPVRLRVKYNSEAWLKALTIKQGAVADAAAAALREIAAQSVREGRANIAGSGHFGPRWLSGLQYKMFGVTKQGQASPGAKAVIFHKSGIAGVFEHGATIEGKPLLWIPTNPKAPPPGRSGKKLTAATINGHPVLFDANDRDRHRKPLYVGVPRVRIPKKWRITEIVKKNVKRFSELFLSRFKVP